MMKVYSGPEGSQARLILIGMITDQKVCSRLTELMDKKGGPRFDIEWADLIAGWCRDHMKEYGCPPDTHIKDIFSNWAENIATNKSTINMVEKLLYYLDEEYRGGAGNNADFILDTAAQYFDRENLRNVIENLQDDVTEGELDEAYRRLSSATRFNLGSSGWTDPLQDIDSWLEAFDDDRNKSLFEYPGALGALVGDSFTKGSLYAFQGIEKVGKSYYLMDAAFRCIKNRKRVAYFEVGDLGKKKTYIRLGQRTLQNPAHEQNVDWPVGWSGKYPDKPVYETRYKEGASFAHAIKRLLRYTRGNTTLLKIFTHPNSSITAAGIESCLTELGRTEHWLPEAVIIDYADILAPPHGITEPNQQIDMTWKHLRRMSQNLNCLVLTATQSGAQAYRKGKNTTILTKSDFQGRRTKFAEVDGMLGLNATDHDMQNGVTRINWIVRREGHWSVGNQVVVAGCLAAATPIILSKFADGPKDTSTTESAEYTEPLADTEDT